MGLAYLVTKMKQKDALIVYTYWKKGYNLKGVEVRILKGMAYSTYPITVTTDLAKELKCFGQNITNNIGRLIKSRLIVIEKRGTTNTFYVTRKGYEFLGRWEKEEGQVLEKQIIQE